MLSQALDDKLKYFNEKKFEISDNEVLLVEKETQGKVHLKCKLDKETLVFHAPADNVLAYLDEQKKYATAGPDKFLFQLDSSGKWILHIMEFKKTINISTLKKSKIQFVMGIYNARAIAGFLNISISKIFLYSAYRSDSCSLIEMRSANINADDLKILRNWKNGKCVLVVDLEEKEFCHKKIPLDREGNGECALS